MASPNFQTIKLGRGKHDSPAEGACVMELASMIAGESFSDHPQSVCPVIALFLRSYNDSIDDERRQDLYEYAAKVIGSRGPEELQRARIEHLTAWARRMGHRRWSWSLRPAWLRAITTSIVPPWVACGSPPLIEWRLTDETHAAVLAVIDELLAMGRTEAPDPPVGEPAPRAGRVAPV